MSGSVQPHRWQPTRLLRPWNFPGKKYWSGLPFPTPRDIPDPGIEHVSPALQSTFFFFPSFSRIPTQLEKNDVVPTSSQDEALALYSVSREVPCSVLKWETWNLPIPWPNRSAVPGTHFSLTAVNLSSHISAERLPPPFSITIGY